MLYVHGMGHFHPENVIDNEFLTSLDINTDSEWIASRTGIERRHTVLPLEYIQQTLNQDPRRSDHVSLYSNAETGARAAAMALQRAQLRPDDIGLVIAGGSCPRTSSPAEACLIAARLGITAPAFDVNSACSSFAVQINTLLQMRTEELPGYVLVVNPENLTRATNFSDRRTAVLMGDCTTATIISAKHKARVRVLDAFQESDPCQWKHVVIPAAGHLDQAGPVVQSFAIRRTVYSINRLRRNARPGFHFVGHQANLLMLQAVAVRAELAGGQHLYNVDRRGNCGAAGAPSVVSEYWDKFEAGSELIMAVVGAGLTWAGLRMDFGMEYPA